MKRFVVFSALVAISCSTEGPAADASVDVADASVSDVADALDEAFTDANDASTCEPIALANGLVGYVDRITAAMAAAGGAGSNAAVIPTSSTRDAFASTIARVLANDVTAFCALPAPYRVARTSDGIIVAAEMDETGNPAPSLFWGTYAANVAVAPWARVIVEVPHPLFDERTEHEGADLFMSLTAGTLLIAGSHRCADDAGSSCTGLTDACGGALAPYRVSDVAHSLAFPFYAVHAAVSTQSTTPFLQLHGNGEPCPSALVSDGSGAWSDAGLVATFASALEAHSVTVGRCGQGFPAGACDLCATDNVEARFTAGSSDSCSLGGSAYGRFVHVEQQPALRDFPDASVVGYEPVIEAAAATFH